MLIIGVDESHFIDEVGVVGLSKLWVGAQASSPSIHHREVSNRSQQWLGGANNLILYDRKGTLNIRVLSNRSKGGMF